MIEVTKLWCQAADPTQDQGELYHGMEVSSGFWHKQEVPVYGEWSDTEQWDFETIDFNTISFGVTTFATDSTNKPVGATKGVVHTTPDRTQISCWGDGDNDKHGDVIVDTETGFSVQPFLVRFGTTLHLPKDVSGTGWAILYEDSPQPGLQFLLDYQGNWFYRTKKLIEKWVKIS